MTIEQRREAIKTILDMADERYLKEVAQAMTKMQAPTIKASGKDAKVFLNSVKSLIQAAR